MGAADTTVLVTVTGPDRPGVTSVLFAALSRHDVSLLDVEQVVIRGRLTLGVLVACPNDAEALQEELEEAMATVGMSGRRRDRCRSAARPALSTHAVVVLGSPVTARALRSMARELAKQGANIDSIRGVADYPVTGLELLVSAADTGARRTRSCAPGWPRWPSRENVDVAVERGGTGPSRQAAHRLRRRLHPRPGRGHRDARRPGRRRGRGPRRHRGGDARRDRLHRVAAPAGRDPRRPRRVRHRRGARRRSN